MISYRNIILEEAEAAKIIDFRQEFLEKNATKFIVLNCGEELYNKIAILNPHIKINLIRGKLEIMAVLEDTDEVEVEVVGQIRNWRVMNRHLVGHYGGPSGAYKIPDGAGGTSILDPDVSIVLTQRWNNYKANIPNMPALRPGEPDFPRVTPNFIIEVRAHSDLASNVHDKMMDWMIGGVDEGISIDPIMNTVRVYTMDLTTNTITCDEHNNCTQHTQLPASQVLPGFVLDLYNIF